MALDAGPYPKDVSQCRYCGTDVVWMKTRKGKRVPVNVVPTQSSFRGPRAGEIKFQYGEHQVHFDTCTR